MLRPSAAAARTGPTPDGEIGGSAAGLTGARDSLLDLVVVVNSTRQWGKRK